MEEMDEEYKRGLAILESLISGKKRQDGSTWEHAFDMMHGYLERLDLTERLSELHAVHVTGTKGKGSTCAMVESILRTCGYTTGLFTSPHLIDVRERIRINGEKVEKDLFLRHLYSTYNALDEKNGEDSGKPAYFRFLTLLGFRIFLEQRVDVAILEVGLGGRLDATNCIRDPVVCGVSPIGFDHMNILGNTLREISTEKAGIFKPGCPALTVPQELESMETLQKIAEGKQVSLAIVPPLEDYTFVNEKGNEMKGSEISLGLAGEHQLENAALAVRLAAIWESRYGHCIPRSNGALARSENILKHRMIPKEYAKGLSLVKWPGRGDVFSDPEINNLTYFVDGAHTPESVASCASWFALTSSTRERDTSTTERILVFNCMEERDPASLLLPLQNTLLEHKVWPKEVIFSPTMSSYSKLDHNEGLLDTSWQSKLLSTWKHLTQAKKADQNAVVMADQKFACNAVMSPSLVETLNRIKSKSKSLPSKKLHVLVTGSLYLVGDMLQLLGRSV